MNQKILYQEIEDYFSYTEKEELEHISVYETVEKNHGRIEKRKYLISADIEYLTRKDN